MDKANLLAEAFDGYLGTMERFYNQYVLIPEGEYMVGSKTPKRHEQPEHRVKLEAFYMGKFPVTNALFEIFVEKTGYTTTAEKLGCGTVYCGRCQRRMDPRTGLIKYTFHATVRDETVNGACWYQPFGPGSTLHQKRNHPVVQVSLEDAMAFAAWTGKRLPTEDEWEAAARTGDGRVFPWGNEWRSRACNIEEGSAADTTSVDTYAAMQNDLGIVDTLGNVLEWTSDTYETPHDAKNSPGCQIAKGGSWISGHGIRPWSRFKVDPVAPSNILGFRCVAY
jgi:formylglycine-generating enzyme required for sulfatase activity